LDSSILSTRLGALMELLPRVLLLELLPDVLELVRFWLRSCHGTGINLPAVNELDELLLLGVPVTLERLEGTVSRPEVDVSLAAPADDSDSTANWIRPLCGSTITSRMLPSVLPS